MKSSPFLVVQSYREIERQPLELDSAAVRESDDTLCKSYAQEKYFEPRKQGVFAHTDNQPLRFAALQHWLENEHSHAKFLDSFLMQSRWSIDQKMYRRRSAHFAQQSGYFPRKTYDPV